MEITDWNSRDTLPRDGTRVRILWSNGKEDVGHFEPIRNEASRQNYSEVAPECLEIGGEWSTDYGNADGAGPDPVGWMPLSPNA